MQGMSTHVQGAEIATVMLSASEVMFYKLFLYQKQLQCEQEWKQKK